MSESEDIVVRLRLLRDFSWMEPADKQLVSEAIAEIVELRGRAIQAERRVAGIPPVPATPAPAPAVVPKIPRGRAIRST